MNLDANFVEEISCVAISVAQDATLPTNAVLLGSPSFWEGVDVPGDAVAFLGELARDSVR